MLPNGGACTFMLLPSGLVPSTAKNTYAKELDHTHGRLLSPSHPARHYHLFDSGEPSGTLHGQPFFDQHKCQRSDFSRSSMAQAGARLPGGISAKQGSHS